jgi:hypothetical protein
MPSEHPLVTRKKQRILEKKAELSELKIRCEVLERGIAEDEADLELARTKQNRRKKTQTPQTSGSGSAQTEH